ncbi:hypothetical protein BH716_17565 [Lelliottia nimipressuralis]|nr:hypothetical protein BH716_17565 [Lelliottia nimipressuralis]
MLLLIFARIQKLMADGLALNSQPRIKINFGSHLDSRMVFAFSRIPPTLNISVLIIIIRNMKDVCFGMMKRSVLNGP